MPSSPEPILEQVARKITPSDDERKKMLRLADDLTGKIEGILSGAGIQGTVTLQGSFARDTWVKGEADIDIFAKFPHTMERREWEERVLPVVRKGLSHYDVIERYAEHPFLEFRADSIRVNIVPCYEVAKGEWQSATDRTPYHTEFMKANLTDELRSEARLLKKFAKGINVYGAEIKIGGFSGMLIDTLSLYYRSFNETIKQVAQWRQYTRLEMGKPASTVESKEREQNVDLIVIDPVDPNRNLAAAVRPDKLWTFVGAARQFLADPGEWYFFPPHFKHKTGAQFGKQLAKAGGQIIAVTFKHPVLVPDILWGQLMKLERSLAELLTREDFRIYRSKAWSDEKKESAILLETERATISRASLHRGPPVFKGEDSLSFQKKHFGAKDTVRGPWIEGDRWIVEKRRRTNSIKGVVRSSLRDETYGLTVPRQIGESFPRTLKVLEGREVFSLLRKEGFDEILWEFLEAKPAWLKSTP